MKATDRCDKCGAQATHRAHKVKQDLLFCSHHAREYGPGLVEKGFAMETDEKVSSKVA